MTDEIERTQEEDEIKDFLDKVMVEMVKLTGCEKDCSFHRGMLTVCTLAILRAGGHIRWFGEMRDDEEAVLEKLCEERKEGLTVVRELVEWFNKHTYTSGKGPDGPPPTPPIPKGMLKKVKIK